MLSTTIMAFFYILKLIDYGAIRVPVSTDNTKGVYKGAVDSGNNRARNLKISGHKEMNLF